MSEDLEAVLRRVAAGELSPEEALHALGEAPSAPSGATTPSESSPAAPGSSEKLPVYGTPPEAQPDSPTVRTASAGASSEIPHSLRELPPTKVRLKT